MKRILVLTALMLFGSALYAQTLTTTAVASGIKWQGNWYAASETTEQLPLYYAGASKNTVFSAGSRQIIVPGEFTSYLALASIQPDISGLLSRLGGTISPTQFNVAFDLGGGITTFTGLPSEPTIAGRINVAYDFSASNSLTTGFAEGGFIGTQRFWGVSAGWEHVFNATNAVGDSNSPSLRMKRMVTRAKVKLVGRQQVN